MGGTHGKQRRQGKKQNSLSKSDATDPNIPSKTSLANINSAFLFFNTENTVKYASRDLKNSQLLYNKNEKWWTFSVSMWRWAKKVVYYANTTPCAHQAAKCQQDSLCAGEHLPGPAEPVTAVTVWQQDPDAGQGDLLVPTSHSNSVSVNSPQHNTRLYCTHGL